MNHRNANYGRRVMLHALIATTDVILCSTMPRGSNATVCPESNGMFFRRLPSKYWQQHHYWLHCRPHHRHLHDDVLYQSQERMDSVPYFAVCLVQGVVEPTLAAEKNHAQAPERLDHLSKFVSKCKKGGAQRRRVVAVVGKHARPVI